MKVSTYFVPVMPLILVLIEGREKVVCCGSKIKSKALNYFVRLCCFQWRSGFSLSLILLIVAPDQQNGRRWVNSYGAATVGGKDTVVGCPCKVSNMDECLFCTFKFSFCFCCCVFALPRSCTRKIPEPSPPFVAHCFPPGNSLPSEGRTHSLPLRGLCPLKEWCVASNLTIIYWLLFLKVTLKKTCGVSFKRITRISNIHLISAKEIRYYIFKKKNNLSFCILRGL